MGLDLNSFKHEVKWTLSKIKHSLAQSKSDFSYSLNRTGF